MKDFFTSEQLKQPIDVTAIENALVDLLVRAEDEDIDELGLKKGVMQLVEAADQASVLANLGKLTSEVELGGSAANALRGMAILGARLSYSSAVGEDEYGQAFSNRLAGLSIVNRLSIVKNPTGVCLVIVTPDGERTMNTHLGACRNYAKSHVPADDIRKSKIFFTTGYIWDTPSQIDAITHALDVAKESKVKIALDVADPFVVSRSGDVIRSLMRGTLSLIFANAEEAQMLVGCRGEKAAKVLGETVEIAVVKDGAQGAYICHDGKITFVQSIKTNVIDTTGAGDMFAGGFMYGLSRGLSMETCGRIATILASDTISHMGVRLSPNIASRVKEILPAR